jgi:hypothetical protein
MGISRRIAAVLSGLVMVGAVSTAPALAAGSAARTVDSGLAASTDPSNGFCDQSEDGMVKLGGDNHLYHCRYVDGLGWYWLPY